MKLFLESGDDIEDMTDQLVWEFLESMRIDKGLRRYVLAFGLTGTAGRGQASSSSDLDFMAITDGYNILLENRLKGLFEMKFNSLPVETSILTLKRKVYGRPDLMLYEFARSAKIFYGSIDEMPGIDDIPKWDGLGVLSYKCNPFICADDNNLKDAYSKLITGINEAFLLLEGLYETDTFQKLEMGKWSRHLAGFPGFSRELQRAYDFRYGNGEFPEGNDRLRQKGMRFLKQAWRAYLEELFGTDYEEAVKLLAMQEPERRSTRVKNRLLASMKYWKFFRKPRIFLASDPYIRELLMIQDYLAGDHALKGEICMSWKCAPRWWNEIESRTESQVHDEREMVREPELIKNE